MRDALTGVRIAELPVTLRLWDGSVLDGGAPVIEVRDPVAIAHILHAPGQLGLARSWVAGALDVEDVADLEAILCLRSYQVELTPRDIARLFAAAVRDNGAAGVMVTHSDASAAVADRVLTLGADGLVERRGR